MQLPSKFRSLTAVGVSTLGLVGASTLFATGAGAALPEATEFAFTGAAQSYVVPGNVCVVEIVAAGAQGGTWGGEGQSPSPTATPGGLGGVATSTISVTPGATLQVNVGGMGGHGSNSGGGAGGWNGGGAGGGTTEVSDGGGSGGGGGASDVRLGGTTLGDRVVVGGGGGGTGASAGYDPAYDAYGQPGVGGNPATDGGDEPPPPPEETYIPATGGGAGTATAGGAAGIGAHDSETAIPDGEAGVLGDGGDGAPVPLYFPGKVGAGGGGGGLYGGGGGGLGLFHVSTAGGGGSSLGESTIPGANEGNGEVTITPTAGCEEPTTTTQPVDVAATTSAKPATAVAAKPDYTG